MDVGLHIVVLIPEFLIVHTFQLLTSTLLPLPVRYVFIASDDVYDLYMYSYGMRHNTSQSVQQNLA